jgi:hypothetical protein
MAPGKGKKEFQCMRSALDGKEKSPTFNNLLVESFSTIKKNKSLAGFLG